MRLCASEEKSSCDIPIPRIIRGYLDRWGVEECYKFLKQSFGIEKARVASYEGIRCLLGVSMFAWQVLIDVSADDELKSIVIAEAKMIGLHMVYKKWGNAKIF